MTFGTTLVYGVCVCIYIYMCVCVQLSSAVSASLALSVYYDKLVECLSVTLVVTV